MSDESAPAAPAALEPGIEALPPKPLKRSSLFTDPDAAAAEALAKAPKSAPRRGPPTKAERREAEAEVDELLGNEPDEDDQEDEDDEPRARTRKPAEDDDQAEEKPRKKPKAEPETAEQPDADDAPAEPVEGTKKKPHKRDDLPEDVFVEVKVDGEKHVVNLKELADSFSGQKAIAARLAKIGEERAAMSRQVDEAKKEVHANGAYFERLLRNPDMMYDILSRSDELEHGTLQRLFERRYKDLTDWQQDPTARARFLYERNQKAIDNQRKLLEARQNELQEESHRRVVEQHRMSVIKPGWNEGLRRAGLVGQKIEHPDFVPTAQMKLDKRARELAPGESITQEDVAQAVQFAAKFVGLKPTGVPPVKRPIIPPRAQQTQQRARGVAPNGQKWDEVPRHRRSMDPDYLMQGTKVRR